MLIVNSRSILVLWPFPRQASKGSEINLNYAPGSALEIYTGVMPSLSQWTLPQHLGGVRRVFPSESAGSRGGSLKTHRTGGQVGEGCRKVVVVVDFRLGEGVVVGCIRGVGPFPPERGVGVRATLIVQVVGPARSVGVRATLGVV